MPSAMRACHICRPTRGEPSSALASRPGDFCQDGTRVPTMQMATGSRFGTYEVMPMPGAGGMGDVCRTRDTILDRDDA